MIVIAAMTLTVIAGLSLLGNPAFATPNPPGNNGTVKIDNLAPPDDDPNNEPHVGCPFEVDFYGFDEGDNAHVTFTAHDPTQREGDDQVLLEGDVFIGEDDNSGGGSEEGLDASETYTLDFTGITPHPQQGFHVKLTVEVDSPHGPGNVKHKVFWVDDCETSSSSTTTTIAGGGNGGTTTSSTTTTTLGGGGSGGGNGGNGGGNGGESSGGQAEARRPHLPKTGSNALPLALAGLALLGLGAASLAVGNRRQRRSGT